VDLHITGGEPTEDERAAIDGLLGLPESGWEGGARDIARDGRTAAGGHSVIGDRHLLLPAFHTVQDRMGWVSRGALNYICRRLSVPPAEAWGVLTFYHLLATEPRPAAVAYVCDDIACRLRGAEQLCQEMEARLGPPLPGSGAAAAQASMAWQRSPCLGQCDAGSAALITRAGAMPERFVLAPAPEASSIVEGLAGTTAQLSVRTTGGIGTLKLLARVGKVDRQP
jgi:NADH-quinone oxidoreductase subunit F